MKKISLSLFAVLLLCMFTFAGCAKADSASLLDCYNTYENYTSEYSTSSKYLFVGETNKTVDLYSATAYNANCYNAINNEQGKFKLLKNNKQYDVLTNTALSFYNSYDTYLNMEIISYEKVVAQNQKSKLYRAIDAMVAETPGLLDSKKALIQLCYQNFNVDNINVLHNLEEFVNDYKSFMGKAINVSVALEEIYTKNMITTENGKIPTGEGSRLLESAKLYLTKYIYIAYIANQEVYYDCSNQNSYKALQSILNGKAINFTQEEPTQDELTMYNYLFNKVESFKTALKNFEIAKQNENSNEAYKTYVEQFEAVAIEFANCIVANLLV